jgi:hypothetical protein
MVTGIPVLQYDDNQITAGEKAHFDKGRWICNDAAMPPDRKYLALCTTRKNVRFHEEGPPEVVAQKPGEPLADPDKLNEAIPRKQWRIGLNDEPEPPWKRWYITIFLDTLTAQLFTHANCTVGARLATVRLEERIDWMRAIQEGAEVMPLFELRSITMGNKYNTLRPDFFIVGWRIFKNGAVRVVDQSAPALKAIAPPTVAEALDDELPDDLAPPKNKKT